MSRTVVVIGAGMGGLTAALRLARAGFRVTVLEAGPDAGGLAGGLEVDGLAFDAGPYILLDRPGLEWAFGAVGLDLAEHVPLRPIPHVYEVSTPEGVRVTFHADLGETAAGLERTWPGSGRRYEAFVRGVARAYRRLQPLQRVSRPGPWDLLRSGGWRDLPFLFRPLGRVLAGTGLPRPVVDALAIWTHVAGQRLEEAPSPLAFVPALIHTVGAAYPAGGIRAVPRALAGAARQAGVGLRFGVRVVAIRCAGGRVTGVETAGGDHLPADAVVSNAGGVDTYLNLLPVTPAPARQRLAQLPLQSPGVCAYLAVRGGPGAGSPYLRFHLPGGGELCRLLVRPGVLTPGVRRQGWQPARLIAPMEHGRAEAGGAAGQRAYLERVLAEGWWRGHVGEHRVLATRIPAEWGARYHLYRDSMNPVMTARFMRAGRLAHRSPYARGLYLAGSSTHPGQWVSFCAVSGVLAADRLREDFR
jgi:phytoene desaturase